MTSNPRFEELPPSILERLGIDREAEEVRRRVLWEAAELSRVSRNTSLTHATKVAREVLLPPSPVPLLLAAWVVLHLLRCTSTGIRARRQLRRHEKVL